MKKDNEDIKERLERLTNEKLSSMKSIARLISIVEILRGDDGCNWDREQTFDTIKNTLVEECFETVDAILKKDNDNLKEEIGDLMLQIVFLAQMANEKKYFSIYDSANAINEKLIRRHPHIFSDSKVSRTDEILSQWEDIKAQERKEKNKEGSVLSSIPKSMPAINKATRLMDKAAHVGFVYKEISQAFDKVKEELGEVEEAFTSGTKEHLEEEIGDLIMTVIDFARMNKIDADTALNMANEKFIRRFSYIEKKSKDIGRDLTSMSLEEMDSYWKEAKGLEKKA